MRGRKAKTTLKTIAPFIGAFAIIIVAAVAGSLVIGQSLPGEDIGVTLIEISGVYRTPTNPTSNDDVVISCTVYNPERLSITSITLYYVIGGTQYHQTMVSYKATIPKQADGTTVSYHIELVSSSNNDATSTFSYTVHDPVTTTTPTTTIVETYDTVVYELVVFDNEGTDISDSIQTATIRGTISFDVNILGGYDSVSSIKLDITGLSEGTTPSRTYYFTKQSATLWELELDTTTIENGEYLFEFKLTVYTGPIAIGGDPDVETIAFSSFLFGMDEGIGAFSIFGVPLADLTLGFMIGFVIIIGMAFITVVIMTNKRKSNMARSIKRRGNFSK